MTDLPARFDLDALYRAIDARRLRRFLKWPAVAAEIGLPLKTVKSTFGAERMDADTVLAMVRWLGIPPETFVRPAREGPMPEYMPPGTMWRVNPALLHAHLTRAKDARGLTWSAIAAELGDEVAPSSLTRLVDAKRVSIQVLVAIAVWLDEPIQTFTQQVVEE